MLLSGFFRLRLTIKAPLLELLFCSLTSQNRGD